MPLDPEILGELTELKLDIRELKTLMETVQKTVDKSCKNIGEAFVLIRELQASCSDVKSHARRLDDHDAAIADLRHTVGGLKETVIRTSALATFFTAAIVAALIKFFGG
ncbi:MAG: hypothetical protein LBW85_01210 [Deltaproteobacteria bacterium]|jgi:hypothetical protein|nr:hypothetical protein [Deltaproteobacteria bacterium]